jgi:hypothetical protein
LLKLFPQVTRLTKHFVCSCKLPRDSSLILLSNQTIEGLLTKKPSIAHFGELASEETIPYQDDRQIIELLASQPSPEAILAIRPTPALQARMSELLDRNKSGTISRPEEVELDRYLLLGHWVRLAKTHAHRRLQALA